MNRLTVALSVSLLFAFLLGCSTSVREASPVLPDLSNTPGRSDLAANVVHRDLWGWWHVQIDPLGGTAEVLPARTPQLRANVTQWMQPPLGKTSNLRITVVDASTYMTDGRITVDVSLTHPFPGLDQYTGFDVHGVFMHDGTVGDRLDSTLLYSYEGADAAILENPDGYTRWWNYSEFNGGMPILSFTPGALANLPNPSATLNSYKYFADGLDPEEELTSFLSDPATVERRALFSAGGTNTRRYYLQFPVELGAPVLKFQYAVAAGWEEPDPALSGDPDVLDIPGDFPLSANQQEPCAIGVDASDSTLFYAGPGEAGGSLVLDLEVFHWQALDPGQPEFQLASIGVSACTSCTEYPVAVTLEGAALDAARIPGSGTAISSVWHVEITDVVPTASGMVPFLVTAKPADPTSYDQGYGQPVPSAALAAYQLGWVEISTEPGCIPPTAHAEATTSTDILVGESVTFDASATTGTPPFTWHWDWDGDSVYDESTDNPVISHTFTEYGTYDVMCKAENACGEDEIDAPITVEANCGTDGPTYVGYSASGSASTTPYYWIAINATVNDPDPKLVGPGHPYYTVSESKIFLAPVGDPDTATASYTYSGGGQIGYYRDRMTLDGTTEGVDRIFFVSHIADGTPVFVDWDGSAFSNETVLTSVSGSIQRMCVIDDGDLIAYNYWGQVYRWDKQNNYQVQSLFQFQNNSSSIPYGSSMDLNVGKPAYDPATGWLLFPVDNPSISASGQLYGFTLSGTREFVDQDLMGEPLTGIGSMDFGVTIDQSAPSCRVLVHGGMNSGPMFIARFVNDMTEKHVTKLDGVGDSSGGRWGTLSGDYLYTNSNNWTWGVIWRLLPSDW